MTTQDEQNPPQVFDPAVIKVAGRTPPKRRFEDNSLYVNGFLLLIAFQLAYLFLGWFSANVGFVFPVTGGLVVILFAAGTIYTCWQWLAKRRRWRTREFDEPDRSARLWCIGPLEKILRYGDFVDTPFEPRVFRAWLVQQMPKWLYRYQVLIFIVCFGAILAVMARSPTFTWCTSLWLVFQWAIGATLLVSNWLWPSYFRVVPGRLELIRFSTLRNRTITIEFISLRDSRVIVDLDYCYLFISEPRKKTFRHHRFTIRYVLDRTRLAHAIYWAALSTHESPPLPNDRLLG